MPCATHRPAGPPPALDPDTDLTPDPAGQVLRQFRSIFSAVRTHFREIEKSAGLGGAQVWALGTIRDRPGIGVGELAAVLDVHQSTASNLARALLARELIRSEQGTRDRRAVKLRILPAGRVLLRKAPGPVAGILPQALAELDPQTLARLHADLGMLLQHIGHEDARTPLAEM